MTWTIAEVARMSGVTARTLRHYDGIGLLAPAALGAGGLRLYGEPELLTLQRILVLRELDLPLAEIRAVIDERVNPIDALRAQHARLLGERDRLAAVVRTVEATLLDLESQEGTGTMIIERPENLFEGFDPSRYEKEVEERWPDEAATSRAYAASLTPGDTERLQREQTALIIHTGELMVEGAPVTDPRVQDLMRTAFESVSRLWTPNREAFIGLGRMLAEDPRMAVNYERVAVGLAAYTRDAYAAFAEANLR